MALNLSALQKPKLDLTALKVKPSIYTTFRAAEAAEAEAEFMQAKEQEQLGSILSRAAKTVFNVAKTTVEKAPLNRFIQSIASAEPLVESFKKLLPTEEEAITAEDPEKLAIQVFNVMPIGMADKARKAAQIAKAEWEAQQILKRTKGLKPKLPAPEAYHIYDYADKKFIETQAKKTDIIKGVDVFVHRPLNQKTGWIVSEKTTGTGITTYPAKTIPEAISHAKEILTGKSSKEIQDAIKSKKEIVGERPVGKIVPTKAIDTTALKAPAYIPKEEVGRIAIGIGAERLGFNIGRVGNLRILEEVIDGASAKDLEKLFNLSKEDALIRYKNFKAEIPQITKRAKSEGISIQELVRKTKNEIISEQEKVAPVAKEFVVPKAERLVEPTILKPTPKIPTEPLVKAIPKELHPLAQEARKYKSAEEFSDALIWGKLNTKENVKSMQKFAEGFRGITGAKQGDTQAAIDFFTQAVKGIEKVGAKVRQMKTSKEIPSLEKAAEVAKISEKKPPTKEVKLPPKIQEVSYTKDTTLETKISQETDKIIEKKDITKTVQDNTKPIKPEPELITTRKFKQTDEWKDFAKYAEENLQDKDIRPAVFFRHTTLTMERVAEFLDGGLGGRTYKEIVKPVYDSAKKMTIEGNAIKNEVDNFRVLEGSMTDRDASLFAQGKLADTTQKGEDIAKYIRGKYDEFLIRLNKTRAKLGIEPIKKRKDYITHINELNTLSELFGGLERVSIKSHISKLKSELLDMHPDWTPARAFDAAKRKVEGLTGIAQYVDARQPIFKFAKQRLAEYEKDPSIIRSFNAYMPSALRYIYQAENVARNKAFKDVLPANAKEFTRLWNTEQVAGRQPPSFLSPKTKRALMAVRGTLGANTILGNMTTTMMQLTSFPQVFAMAGIKNTFYGIGKRLLSYIPGQHTLFETSRTKALRNLDIDIGLGDSLIDQTLIKIGQFESTRNVAARTRQAVDLGRRFLRMVMETADQFTVGASYEAFYRKAIFDGLTPSNAMEYAEIMTGKTQASYFKEALPPFLNTTEGKTIGQFGTYTMNQWELFRRDFGKEFNFNEKSARSVKEFFKQFVVFLTAAYIVDSISEKTFGRQPYDLKSLIDDSVGFAQGEITGRQMIDTSKETVMSYVPFMGSVKFKSMPPVFDFGSDTISAILGTGADQKTAIDNIKNKWVYNILLPYAGNQTRKTLQGVEASMDIDLPFVKNISDDIDIQSNLDKARAIIFSPYATTEALDYFENKERREGVKEKYNITGTITSDENIAKLKKMNDEEFGIYTAQYTENTIKTINKKMGGKSKELFPIKGQLTDELFPIK